MKKLDRWENIILLVSAILLLPIWFSQSQHLQLSQEIFNLFQGLQAFLLVVLVVMLVRRVRRITVAMRENKNRQGPFSF